MRTTLFIVGYASLIENLTSVIAVNTQIKCIFGLLN